MAVHVDLLYNMRVMNDQNQSDQTVSDLSDVSGIQIIEQLHERTSILLFIHIT